MKFWKLSLITAATFFAVSGTVLYTSCEKDTCADLTCKNGGSCALGKCNCQDGYEGTTCENIAGTKFAGKFFGNHTCPSTSPTKDTVEIWFESSSPNRMKFVEYSKISDTLTGIAKYNTLTFDEINNGSYRKFSIATYNNFKLTIYIDEIYNVNTGEKKTCNFIGFR
jgi:hypothetical protein